MPGTKSGVSQSKKGLDRLALFGSALFLAVAGVGGFLLADKYKINAPWLFGGGASLIFLAVVGWPYRSQFKDPRFVGFFMVWLCVHVCVFLLVLGYLGLLYYLPFVVMELWIGYAIAIRSFGPPRHDQSK